MKSSEKLSVAALAGERRLPACSARLLAARIRARNHSQSGDYLRARGHASKAGCLRRQVGSLRSPENARHHATSFTILELLVVMTIIVVLAGLILATSGYVQTKGKRSRAEAEIAALSAALENYRADNGTYPTDTASGTTNTLDARTMPDPTAAQYAAASVFLYNELSGDPTGNRVPTGKSYFPFKPNMLLPKDQARAVIAIADPFGYSYGYSTANQANPSNGYNPTFDLWSTAGTGMGSTLNPSPQDQWIKNW